MRSFPGSWRNCFSNSTPPPANWTIRGTPSRRQPSSFVSAVIGRKAASVSSLIPMMFPADESCTARFFVSKENARGSAAQAEANPDIRNRIVASRGKFFDCMGITWMEFTPQEQPSAFRRCECVGKLRSRAERGNEQNRSTRWAKINFHSPLHHVIGPAGIIRSRCIGSESHRAVHPERAIASLESSDHTSGNS